MKVVALKPILYRSGMFARVAEKGEEIEMEKETFQWRKKRGEVQEVTVVAESEEKLVVVVDGLPTLDEVSSNARKKRNGA